MSEMGDFGDYEGESGYGGEFGNYGGGIGFEGSYGGGYGGGQSEAEFAAAMAELFGGGIADGGLNGGATAGYSGDIGTAGGAQNAGPSDYGGYDTGPSDYGGSSYGGATSSVSDFIGNVIGGLLGINEAQAGPNIADVIGAGVGGAPQSSLADLELMNEIQNNVAVTQSGPASFTGSGRDFNTTFADVIGAPPADDFGPGPPAGTVTGSPAIANDDIGSLIASVTASLNDQAGQGSTSGVPSETQPSAQQQADGWLGGSIALNNAASPQSTALGYSPTQPGWDLGMPGHSQIADVVGAAPQGSAAPQSGASQGPALGYGAAPSAPSYDFSSLLGTGSSQTQASPQAGQENNPVSSPSPPPDNSLQVEQLRQTAANDAASQARQDAADKATQLNALRSSTRSGAGPQVDQYFRGQGVDPTGYEGDINSQLDSILSSIAPDDPNPGSYFKDAGANVFSSLSSGNQAKQQSALDKLFPPNFETTRTPYSLAQPYEQGIEAEQRGGADAIIQNMLKRGVITNTGATAAGKDLDNQVPIVNSKLNDIGTGVIANEQSSLRDIANRGRQSAAGLKLGQSFDPASYGSEADTNFNDFISKLGDTIRSKVGTGNLFTTAGLAGVAGAAQGAGNTAFNPAAANGIIEDPNDPNSQENRINTTPKSSIF